MDLQPCDIVIPVYNALDELKECVESLIKHTGTSHRIIIINDCSPDFRIKEYLVTLNNIKTIIVLENDKNLGFVGTVNKGMSLSKNDVVLLNSDTVVTSGWLRKITTAAYSNQSIATVTPLTNNGSICSVPNFLEDNKLPQGYSLASFSSFIEQISLKLYPEIPTAVGFCMYIKRKVIDEIGLFDQETFGKGYGEENDFCCRVKEHGYINILADDTFIYHKGSMSFQGDKLNLLNKNLKLLNARYPYYEKMVHDFIVTNPLKKIQDNINIRLPYQRNMENSKGNILFVLHNFFDEAFNNPIGGTEYHVKDVVLNIKDFNSFVLVSNSKELVLKQYAKGELLAKYRFVLESPIGLTHFHHREYSTIIEQIIQSFEIGLVHIHHLNNHTFDIPFVAKNNHVKVLFTLHDYYLFCPKVNLLDNNNEYCKDLRGEMKCNSCMHATHGIHTSFINKWKQKVTEMIEQVDLFITPSIFTQNMFKEEFPSIINRVITIEHGTAKSDYMVFNETNHTNKNLKIGFLGGLAPNKGSEFIYQLVTKYSKETVEWHLIGGLGDQRLNLLEQKNLFKHGKYARENLSNILKEIQLDLVCIVSPWPETFSYTLSEAWDHNIPVLVTPMGALKERVENINGGWVANSSEFKDITYTLDQIIACSKEEWDFKINNIRTHNSIDISEMINLYQKLYEENYKDNSTIGQRNSPPNENILKALRYYIPNDSNISDAQYNNQVSALQQEIESIKSTIGWKVLNKIRGNNNWILRIGKKLIYIILKYKRKY